jgi:hypothetical protein
MRQLRMITTVMEKHVAKDMDISLSTLKNILEKSPVSAILECDAREV